MNSRYFGLAPEGAPEGERHGRDVQWREHFRSLRKVRRTGRDGSTPQDVNSAVENTRLNPPRPSSKSNSISPTRNGNQYIVSPRRSIIATEARNADPLDAPINLILDKHGQSTSTFNKIIGNKTVSGESADVYARVKGWTSQVIPTSPKVQTSWIWGCCLLTQRINSSPS